jgi:hypothetical protein
VFICGQYAFAGKNKLATDEHGQDVECVFLRGDLGRGGQQEVLAA